MTDSDFVGQMAEATVTAVCGTLAGLLVTGWISTDAFASLPVRHKSEGCVIGGQVYSLFKGMAAYRYTMPQGFDPAPYEGENVVLEGTLAPGDQFVPKGPRLPVLGPCDGASLRLIRGK